MKKILITGNMGYIGPILVQRLRKSYPSAFLAGLDMGYFANCLTHDVLPECAVDLQYFADIRRFPIGILEGVDAVIHLAAISNDPIGNAFEEVTKEINFVSSMRLARMAMEMGVKSFIYASSCSMYGYSADGPRSENSPLNPLTAYARSKVNTERELEGLASVSFRITSLRFSTACGFSPRLRLDLVLNDFVAGALSSGKISILSDGTPWRPLINVRDMARAIDWALTRGGSNYLAINVGSNDWNYQVKELAQAVSEEIPGVEIEINRNAQPDKRSYRVSFDLFKQLAPDEYQPRVDLHTTIRELRDGLQSISFKDADFRNSRLMRLMMLKELMSKGHLNQDLEWTNARRISPLTATASIK